MAYIFHIKIGVVCIFGGNEVEYVDGKVLYEQIFGKQRFAFGEMHVL
ncbi:hypothetical protein [Ruminococcus flavefaciens]|nr:hypothetical protein [Ruminococcus flavefaciens]